MSAYQPNYPKITIKILKSGHGGSLYYSILSAIRACPHFFFQMVIVGIVNIDRNRDYTPTYAPEQPGNLQFPTSGKADKFTRFLSSDLIPYIDSHYKTQPYRILAGWSLGGLFTVHTFFENPQLFSAYLAVSPSLWWDKDMYVKRTETILSSGKISNKPLTVTVGTLEGGDIGRSVRDGFVRVMKEKLRQDLSKFK